MRRVLFGIVPILISGCALKSVRTYAAPVPSAPPAGKIRIEPKPPVITKTKAVYEWQLVCDQKYGWFAGVNSTTTISHGTPVNRLAGELPTVEIMFIEIETVPHGDGTMSVKISNGHRGTATRPLLSPSAKPDPGGYGYGSSGSDGHKEMPAGSFVTPLVSSSTLVGNPSSTVLALITEPGAGFAQISASRYNSSGKEEIGFRGSIPLNAKGELPKGALTTPAFKALVAKGYQVSATYGPRRSADKFTIAFKP